MTTTAPIDFTSKLTLKRKGKTLKLTSSIRGESNAGESGGPVSYSLPAVSENVARTLRKLKKARVKLTLTVRSADGSTRKISKSVTLPKS